MIKLNYGYFIEADNLNYILKHTYIFTNKEGQEKEVTKVIGYFSNIRQPIERYLELCQKACLEAFDFDIKEYVKMVEETNKNAIRGLESVLAKYPIK